MGIINYDNAKYSLAMIEFKNYISTVLSIDGKLEDADFIFNRIIYRQNKTEDEIEVLRKFAFTEYAKISQYLKKVKKDIIKYQTELKDFLDENPEKQTDFNAVLDHLIPLVEEQEKNINFKVLKCFECFKESSVTESLWH